MSHEEDTTSNYRIKDIKLFGSHRRILLQSANGPCPLLAICNVLLLRNQLSISPDSRYISFSELVQMVSNLLFDANASSSNNADSSPMAARAANVRENLSSCLEILPKLNVGLDVNCKFAGAQEFEYTKELAVFDLLDIGLYHGWVVSKQDEKAWAAFGHLSYNQIVEKLIAFEEAQQSIVDASGRKAGADSVASGSAREAPEVEEVVRHPSSASLKPETLKTINEGLVIKEFMDRTASQLSYEGLLALHEAVRERELAVFFRNSHFCAIMKYNGDLYLLCTDIAFAGSHLIWEKLDEVDGDTSYVDADFRENQAGSDDAAALAAAEAAQVAMASSGANQATAQADADAMLAWQMMQEDLQAQQLAYQQAAGSAQHTAASGGGGQRQQATNTAQVQGQPTQMVQGTIVGTNMGGTATSGQPHPASATAAAKKCSKGKKTGKSCSVQ
jgi:hypothetical protein